MRVLFLMDDSALNQEPMGTMCLSAFLKRGGHEVCAINADRSTDLAAEVKAIDPALLAISTTTGRHRKFLRYVHTIKSQVNVPAIFGGPHPTVFPEMIDEEEDVDILCRSEGEFALLELCDAMEAGRDFSNIANLWIRQNGQIIRNDTRPFFEDLDSLPFADREIVNQFEVWGSRAKYNHFQTGRGCPFLCTYCSNHVLRKASPGKYVRKRSVENVIREILEVNERYPRSAVFFIDDTMITSKGTWLHEFCEAYRDKVKLPFLAQAKADQLTDQVCEDLAGAGCRIVAIGLENGNDRLRNEVLKKRVSTEDIRQANARLKAHGIGLWTQNMFGIPGETIDTMLETIGLNVELQPAHAHLYLYQPFPGTELAEMAIEGGYFDGDYSQIMEDFRARRSRMALSFPDKDDMRRLALLTWPCIGKPKLFDRVKRVYTAPRDTAFARLKRKALIRYLDLRRRL